MSQRRQLLRDVAVSGVLMLLGIAILPFLVVWGQQTRPVDAGAYGLTIVAAGSFLLRRWPLVPFVIVTAATSAYHLLGYPYGPILLSLATAAYTIARRLRPRVAGIAAIVALPVLLAHAILLPILFVDGHNDGLGVDGMLELVPGSAWVIVPFSIGFVRRVAVESAQRQRADAQRRILDQERLRLASEVHDIVGHGLAAIRMQADVARHVSARKPEQAQIALDAISRTSAEALTELRATLAEISPEVRSRSHDIVTTTPGLDRLDDLCDRMREAGVDVELQVRGRPRPLPADVDVTAYRVVQQSLTNAAAHASEARARIRVTYTTERLMIDVVNPSVHPGPVREGLGLSGMRRRVAEVAGAIDVEAGDREFRVAVTLPAEVALEG